MIERVGLTSRVLVLVRRGVGVRNEEADERST